MATDVTVKQVHGFRALSITDTLFMGIAKLPGQLNVTAKDHQGAPKRVPIGIASVVYCVHIQESDHGIPFGDLGVGCKFKSNQWVTPDEILLSFRQ